MDEAARQEEARRLGMSRKPALPEPTDDLSAHKKFKTDQEDTQNVLASFKSTTLLLSLVTELVIANLVAIDSTNLTSVVEESHHRYRQ